MSEMRMTPSGAVTWSCQQTSAGLLVFPDEAPKEAIDLLFCKDPSMSLEKIGVGERRWPAAAAVYRSGDTALRVVEYASGGAGGHGDISWLQANLTLREALSSLEECDDVTTPEYFGALLGSKGAIFAMSYEGEGRSHACWETKGEVMRVYYVCKKALISYSGVNHGICFDSKAANILVGEEGSDLPSVKLDVYPNGGFIV